MEDANIAIRLSLSGDPIIITISLPRSEVTTAWQIADASANLVTALSPGKRTYLEFSGLNQSSKRGPEGDDQK